MEGPDSSSGPFFVPGDLVDPALRKLSVLTLDKIVEAAPAAILTRLTESPVELSPTQLHEEYYDIRF